MSARASAVRMSSICSDAWMLTARRISSAWSMTTWPIDRPVDMCLTPTSSKSRSS